VIRLLDALRPWVLLTGASAAALAGAHWLITLAVTAATTAIIIGMYEITHEGG
jgi:hypothetical protein